MISRTGSQSLNNGILLILFAILRLVTSLDISYCSSQNTGAGNGPYSWPFQSNGHCQDTCKFQYAYAILQDVNCWCSNYAPYNQTDEEQCDVNCPGFPSEKCGNLGAGLFGYYQLSIEPSGTVGAPAAPPSSIPQTPFPTPAAPTTVTATVLATVTNSPTPTSSSSTPSTFSAPIFTTTSSIAIRTTITPTPITVVTTVRNSVQTVTVTPTMPSSAEETTITSTPTSTQSQSPSQPSTPTPTPDPFWSSTAKVAGTFTVVAVVIALLLAGLGFFCWRRFRSNDSVAIRSVSDHDGQSTHGRFFGGITEKRHSRLGLGGVGGVSGRRGSHDRTPPLATPVSMSRRASQPMVHDQRLNPNALYAMGQDHGSRVSLESFQDDRDYSRPVLHVRNPDA